MLSSTTFGIMRSEYGHHHTHVRTNSSNNIIETVRKSSYSPLSTLVVGTDKIVPPSVLPRAMVILQGSTDTLSVLARIRVRVKRNEAPPDCALVTLTLKHLDGLRPHAKSIITVQPFGEVPRDRQAHTHMHRSLIIREIFCHSHRNHPPDEDFDINLSNYSIVVGKTSAVRLLFW